MNGRWRHAEFFRQLGLRFSGTMLVEQSSVKGVTFDSATGNRWMRPFDSFAPLRFHVGPTNTALARMLTTPMVRVFLSQLVTVFAMCAFGIFGCKASASEQIASSWGKTQMGEIHAAPMFAGAAGARLVAVVALMINVQAIRNIALDELPGNAMRHLRSERSVRAASDAELTISIRSDRSSPRPTLIGFADFYFGPESLSKLHI